MAHFLFIDESGYDSGESPYAVLGGVAIEDRELWSIVKDIRSAELKHFGTAYSSGQRELKAKKLLNRKVFRHAWQLSPFTVDRRVRLARECLEQGDRAGRAQITGLAQAKIAYVAEVMDICSRFRCKAFASIVNKASPKPLPDHLRKDYAYLFAGANGPVLQDDGARAAQVRADSARAIICSQRFNDWRPDRGSYLLHYSLGCALSCYGFALSR